MRVVFTLLLALSMGSLCYWTAQQPVHCSTVLHAERVRSESQKLEQKDMVLPRLTPQSHTPTTAATDSTRRAIKPRAKSRDMAAMAALPISPTQLAAQGRTNGRWYPPQTAGEKIDYNSQQTLCDCREPPTSNEVTVFVQNPRTGSFFLSGRLNRYAKRLKFVALRTKDLLPRPTVDLDGFEMQVCSFHPGYKVFAYDSGASPNWWLKFWPCRSALVLTGDESGRWGLFADKRFWGPFGVGEREEYFETNRSAPVPHILLPRAVRPWFRQYFDQQQHNIFGKEALYFPLGSRVEFPDISDSEIKPASQRRYVYSFMGALTDSSRQALFAALVAFKDIPASRSFVHLAAKWHPELDNAEYVDPQAYSRIMLESAFTPCPKGRGLDTFRLYEAMEAGSIPIIELAGGYARQHLPPAYFESPMLFVEAWEQAPEVMFNLAINSSELDRRQQQVMAWYHQYMMTVVASLEQVILAH